MRLIVFTKKVDCQIYLCFEELYKKKKLEYYVYDHLD